MPTKACSTLLITMINAGDINIRIKARQKMQIRRRMAEERKKTMEAIHVKAISRAFDLDRDKQQECRNYRPADDIAYDTAHLQLFKLWGGEALSLATILLTGRPNATLFSDSYTAHHVDHGPALA